MIRSSSAFALLLCFGVTLTACKKDEAASSTAASASASATAAATASAADTASAAPADSASAAPSGEPSAAPADSGTPAASGTPVAVNAPQRGIEDCCAALAAVATGGRGKAAKNRAFRSLEICPQLAAMVRSGHATRQQALTQVRSGLAGHPAPAACR